MVLVLQGAAEAAEVRVLSTGAMTAVTDELYDRFERASGHKLVVQYRFGPVLKGQIEAGEAFDVAVLSLDVGLIGKDRIAAGSRVVLGRTGIGVCVRKDAPKPDIGTSDAFKRALLAATSVAYSGAGSSGLYFVGLLDRLGIAAEMKSKIRPMGVGHNPADAVARREAEMAVVGAALIPMAPGADLVGWLPAELQNYVVFTGGLSAAAKEPGAGNALLNFLTSPPAVALFKANGLEPITP